MRLREIYEDASAGASSSGSIASVANPPLSKKKRKSNRYGAPSAAQHTAKNGTLINALDVNTSIFGGPPLKR
jgi:hypothetical protein